MNYIFCSIQQNKPEISIVFCLGAVGDQMCTNIFQLQHLEVGKKAVLGSVLGIREGALAGLVFPFFLRACDYVTTWVCLSIGLNHVCRFGICEQFLHHCSCSIARD